MMAPTGVPRQTAAVWIEPRDALRRLDAPDVYAVRIVAALEGLARRVDAG